MQSDTSEADVYRVRVRARFKKNLVAALRELRRLDGVPQSQPVRGADGRYLAMLFVCRDGITRLRADAGIEVVESVNLSAQLRATPRETPDPEFDQAGVGSSVPASPRTSRVG